MEHLARAREDLRTASNHASGEVQRQLDSIQEGLFEEDEGDKTQDDPGPKVDRITEVVEKLERLEGQVENEPTRDHVGDALEHLREYLKDHPHGGEGAGRSSGS